MKKATKSLTVTKADQWAAEIRQQVGKSVESIVAVGRLLINAKADIIHGEWTRMFKEQLVPFDQRTAEKFMAIAAHPLISNSSNFTNLPPVYTTLYALTEVEPVKLKNALHDKVITAQWKGKDVKGLMPPKPAAEPKAQKALPSATDTADMPTMQKSPEQWFNAIKNHIEAAMVSIPAESRPTLIDSLVVLLSSLGEQGPSTAQSAWASAARAD